MGLSTDRLLSPNINRPPLILRQEFSTREVQPEERTSKLRRHPWGRRSTETRFTRYPPKS